jgi:Subtilase family
VRLALPKSSQLVPAACIRVLFATAVSGMLIAWPQAASAADKQNYEVGIAGLRFDPKQVDRAIPKRLRMSVQELRKHRSQPSYYLVQLHRIPDAETRTQLIGKLGLGLQEYVPNLSYVEKLAPSAVTAAAADPRVRAIIPYQPAFKLSPTIGKFVPRTPERKAIRGLVLRAVLFPDADPQAVVQSVSALGARDVKVHDHRKLKGGVASVVFVVSTAERLPAITRIDGIRWIEEVGEFIPTDSNAAGTLQSGVAANPTVWNQNLHGEGQIIGIIDDGPPDINHCFFRNPFDNTPGPGHRKIVQLRNASNFKPTDHATFVAGIAAGDDYNAPGARVDRGSAWASRLAVGTSEVSTVGELFADLTAAAAAGATIHSNSWATLLAGYDKTASDVDAFTWNNEDMLVLGAVPNTNQGPLSPPATAKNAIGVAAADGMYFGSGTPGPTIDGRRKPDLMAPGCKIQSARSAVVGTNCATAGEGCATSWATPNAAAAAALARQYFTEGWFPSGTPQPLNASVPSGALLKAMLINSTVDMTGIAGNPSNREGWGVIRLDRALYFADATGARRRLRVWDTRNPLGLTHGETRTHTVTVQNSAEPLKVVLVWTEPPATPGTANPMMNNLDLSLVSPDGIEVALIDDRNNVEVQRVNAPQVGQWTIKVTGTKVVTGIQGYAVVATSGYAQPELYPEDKAGITNPATAVEPWRATLSFQIDECSDVSDAKQTILLGTNQDPTTMQKFDFSDKEIKSNKLFGVRELSLHPDTTYYWRVDNPPECVGLPPAPVRSFKTKPKQTTLLSPLGGGKSGTPDAVIEDEKSCHVAPADGKYHPWHLVFKWEPVAGAERYRIEVATDDQFTKDHLLGFLVDKYYEWDNEPETTAVQLDVLVDKHHFWRVTPIGPPSDLADDPQPNSNKGKPALATFDTVLPRTKLSSTPGPAPWPVTLEWDAVCGAKGYNLWLYRNDSLYWQSSTPVTWESSTPVPKTKHPLYLRADSDWYRLEIQPVGPPIVLGSAAPLSELGERTKAPEFQIDPNLVYVKLVQPAFAAVPVPPGGPAPTCLYPGQFSQVSAEVRFKQVPGAGEYFINYYEWDCAKTPNQCARGERTYAVAKTHMPGVPEQAFQQGFVIPFTSDYARGYQVEVIGQSEQLGPNGEQWESYKPPTGYASAGYVLAPGQPWLVSPPDRTPFSTADSDRVVLRWRSDYAPGGDFRVWAYQNDSCSDSPVGFSVHGGSISGEYTAALWDFPGTGGAWKSWRVKPTGTSSWCSQAEIWSDCWAFKIRDAALDPPPPPPPPPQSPLNTHRCSAKVQSGGNLGSESIIEMDGSSGTFSVAIVTYDIADELRIYCRETIPGPTNHLFNTGCLSTDPILYPPMPYSCTGPELKAILQPNCLGTPTTAWAFVVGCK